MLQKNVNFGSFEVIVLTETSQARGQGSRGGRPSCRGCDDGGQAGWGCIRHITDHSRGAWAQIYQVVLCSLTEDLMDGE